MLPSAVRAIRWRASRSMSIRSPSAIRASCSMMTPGGRRWKSKHWQRELMVAGILSGSVVAKMKMTPSGGSSRVFNRALKAPLESIWTSSIT